ncbi:diphenol oxidase-A2 [Hymenopellis radicata]|nr:diphenol oxidase-A2 [Hymenopellis radicata]
MADVEMKPADTKDKKDEEETVVEEPKKEPETPVSEIKSNIALIERAVSTLEPRFTHRALRTLTGLRKKVDDTILYTAISEVYLNGSSVKDDTAAPPAKPPSEPLPEVEIYFRLLLIHQLLKSSNKYPKALELVHQTVEKMQALNRRSMDPIAAKIWFAVERAYKLGGEIADARPLFLAAQRTASLRHDDEAQASLINRLLRSYLHYSLYDQADKLVSKTTFPESAANPQYARYHYFIGRIEAVQLNYSAAHSNLQQAIRRSPPAKVAPGFYQAVHKLFVVVELLMGDIPDRSLFRHPVLEKALSGYFEIVKAVRTGSLSQFQTTLSKHAAQFESDKTYTLIVRLRQNVIKTGYQELHLDSEEDAEYIVGKAIRDGVIEGKIVHEKGWLECGTQKNAYGSEVGELFQRRIAYCLELHNQSVKAMRYPLNAHRKELAAAEGARERQKELAKEIQDGDLDDDHMGEEF